ncbi:hypothetical protein [Sphingomonas corticis]|jgi:hypothetical protein|uniref:Lipocalin-like domain-containing protein n=1 Tax=Sphingomonas corticis TaxID=2722791 RepID=A0ABX1CNU8_9SPHN|nr:hypothetical protein [Sphingomonas corticis]NJR77980.1 hypothetical protein [Sphingomonas corticis]
MKTPLATGAGLALLLIAATAAAQASPWFGTWSLRPKDAGGKPETLVYSDAGGGAMRMESVEQRSVIVTRFDGIPAADVGAGAAKGNALAVKAISPTVYDWTFFTGGKPFVQGRNTLAPDRNSFSEVSWLVGKPGDIVTLVYERR